MKTAIFDLDGTLIDSYPLIVDKLMQLTHYYGLNYSHEEILEFVKMQSVGAFVASLEKDDAHERLKTIQSNVTIPELPNASALLEKLKNSNIPCFIYTHSGNYCLETLENLNMLAYFTEVVTSDYGFQPKPSPEGIQYLIDKYELDVKNTYYIGDRSLDIESAQNAGIQSIFYGVERHLGDTVATYTVADLLEVHDLMTQ